MPGNLYCSMVRFCAPTAARAGLILAIGLHYLGAAGPIAEGQPGNDVRLLVWQLPKAAEAAKGLGTSAKVADLEEGSRLVLVGADPGGGAPDVELLTTGFTAVGKPDLSFDAERVLFAGRRAGADQVGIWELSLRTQAVRKVVDCSTPCDRALYLSTLYKLDAPAPIDQIAFRAEDQLGAPQLFRCQPDGGDLQQITFVPYGVADPLLLSDGRLLFGVHAPGAASEQESTHFLTINTDGTDVFPFAGQHDDPATRTSPAETAGRVVFVESSEGKSTIASVRVSRSLKTREVIAELAGQPLAFTPLTHDQWLASRQTEAYDYGIFVLNYTNSDSRSYFDSGDYHDLTVAVVKPRSKPPGRSTVVDSSVGIGQLYCLNAYLSDLPQTQSEKRQIARVRVYSVSEGGSDSSTLGELEVEKDGSLFAELPARLPLQLETLDGEGQTLQRMRSWFWIMPKERRGCIGCHEDRELSPPNRHVFALRKLPQRLGTQSQETLQKEE